MSLARRARSCVPFRALSGSSLLASAHAPILDTPVNGVHRPLLRWKLQHLPPILPQQRDLSTTPTQRQKSFVEVYSNVKEPARASRDLSRSRRCLVTGGTSGIGFEVARRLALNDTHFAPSHVYLVSRSAERAEQAIEKIKADIRDQEISLGYVVGDLVSPEVVEDQLRRYDEQALKQPNPQPINTLINCAGLSQTNILNRTGTDEISGILKTNLEASIILSRRMLKSYASFATKRKKESRSLESGQVLASSPAWCVINVASLLGLKGGCGASVYAASKAGLIGFTRALALEGAAIAQQFEGHVPPFRSNVVVPGYIDTAMTAGFSCAYKGSLNLDIPLRRFGTPCEVAEAVMFLLGNEYANNCVLNLDGGLSAT